MKEQPRLLYFSYGSNMSVERLSQRTPSAEVVGVASLSGYQLKFHKAGQDGSAKCDIIKTTAMVSCVFGVVYQLNQIEKYALDKTEGLGFGYAEKQVSLTAANGKKIQALTYFATHIDASLLPFHWYKQHVLFGAKQHDLPAHYVESISQVESIVDPISARHSQEMTIYQ